MNDVENKKAKPARSFSKSAEEEVLKQLENIINVDVDMSANDWIMKDLSKGSIDRAIFGLKVEQMVYAFNRKKILIIKDLMI